jgi:hypothetical protein
MNASLEWASTSTMAEPTATTSREGGAASMIPDATWCAPTGGVAPAGAVDAGWFQRLG